MDPTDPTGPNFEALPPYDGAVAAYLPAPPPPVAQPHQRRRWVGPVLGAGAVALAAGAFLLGHATAGHTSRLTSVASAATSPGDRPTALLSALGVADPLTLAAEGAPCLHGRGGAKGTLKSVSGTTLTVTNKRGTDVTVKTGANTTVTKVITGALGDVTTGSTVAVRGTASGTSAIAAGHVAILPADLVKPVTPKPADPAEPAEKPEETGFAVGTVQSVSGTGFTLKTRDGTTITVTTSSATTFNKAVQVKVSDLTVGQPVSVAGTPNSDGSVNADRIVQSPAGTGFPGFGGRHGFGRSQRPGGSTTSTTTP